MTCRCGHPMVLINAASDTPKCRGCGFPSDGCTCEDVIEDVLQQISALKADGRAPREILIGARQYCELLSHPSMTRLGSLDDIDRAGLFGLPLRAVQLPSCLEVVP